MSAELSPFERRLLEILADIQRRTGNTVRSIAVAVHAAIPERTAKWYLRRLEQRGLVHRPRGKRSGYALVPGGAR